MDKYVALEKRIKAIEQRNVRVESDKAWETSLIRKALIALLTYLTITLFFISINTPSPLINAIVPTLGFLLSTLSLSLFRKIWEKNRK